jgi:hypothetical protein
MRPLHVTAIAVLQRRMVAVGRCRNEFMQVSTPAQPGTPVHCRAHPRGVGQVPRQRPGYPPAHFIERRRSLRQIKHGLLHPGPRRIAIPQHELTGACATVQADAVGCLDPALPGNRHVNRTGRFISEPLELSRSLVAQDRAWSGPEERRPLLGTTARRSGEGQVDPAVNGSPPAAPHPELDHVRRQPGPQGLRARYDSLLLPGEVAQRRGKLTVHAEQCGQAHRQNRRTCTDPG